VALSSGFFCRSWAVRWALLTKGRKMFWFLLGMVVGAGLLLAFALAFQAGTKQGGRDAVE
jgi:hypothetical protein